MENQQPNEFSPSPKNENSKKSSAKKIIVGVLIVALLGTGTYLLGGSSYFQGFIGVKNTKTEVTKNEKLAETKYKEARTQAKIAQDAYERVKDSRDFHFVLEASKEAVEAATLAAEAAKASRVAANAAGTDKAKKSAYNAESEQKKADTAVENLEILLSDLENSGHSEM